MVLILAESLMALHVFVHRNTFQIVKNEKPQFRGTETKTHPISKLLQILFVFCYITSCCSVIC